MNESSSATVQVDFSLAIGPGRLDASLDVPAGEVTLTQLLPVLQTLSSNIIDSTVRVVNEEGYTVSCRAGCGACCRQMVPLSVFEAEGLAAWVRSLPPEQQAALEQRFDAVLLELRGTGILARMDPALWVDGSDEAKTLAIDYLAQYVACPFLVEESCSIHPIRPFACREYLVTSPAEFCRNPATNAVVGIPMPVKLSTMMYKLGAIVEKDNRGWIPLVFLFAWMKSGAEPGRAIAGPGPEVLYEVVKRLET
jgi:Fe-S-cluster containining protein